MKEIIKNTQITELYFRKYLKNKKWSSYILIKTDKEKHLWANDYLSKRWNFTKDENYDFYIYSSQKGKNKGKSFIYDYCLTDKPRELKKQFRSQWLSKKPNIKISDQNQVRFK